MKVLPFRQPAARRVVASLDPRRCHCVVHHPVTAVERRLIEGAIARARAARDFDHVGYLQLRLDSASHCPALRGLNSPMGAA